LAVGSVDHRELGRTQPLDLVARPRRFLEVETGNRFALVATNALGGCVVTR